jgi:hypothetical protein
MSFGLCNAPASFQWCMMAIFADLFEKVMEVFMVYFTVYGKTFGDCLAILDKVLKQFQMADLVLNWEMCHFTEECLQSFHTLKKAPVSAPVIQLPD